MYRVAFAAALLLLFWMVFGVLRLAFLFSEAPQGREIVLIMAAMPLIIYLPILCYLVVRAGKAVSARKPLLPEGFVGDQRTGYRFGMGLIWAGTIGIFLFLVLALVGGSLGGFSGVPLGYCLMCYLLGIAFVEVSLYRWSKAQAA